ncbi:MAG: type II 3-dehydroquinate dehydratase [Vulcanimicrobiota bacterium]
MVDLLIIHGANLNLLGAREKEIFGRSTLEELDKKIRNLCDDLNIVVEILQTNHEGVILDRIAQVENRPKVLIINPGAFCYSSYAIRECIAGVGIPTIEVQLSSLLSRELNHGASIIAPVCAGQIYGFGADSYILAVEAAKKMIKGS